MAVLRPSEMSVVDDMARTYRLIDLKANDAATQEILVQTTTPEMAAMMALGQKLCRSGRPQLLRAKVYWKCDDEQTCMVRLYEPVESRPA